MKKRALWEQLEARRLMAGESPVFVALYSQAVQDSSFFASIRDTLDKATSEFSALIESAGTVEIDVDFDATLPTSRLAEAGFASSRFYGSFASVASGANVFQAATVANLVAGQDLTPGVADAVLTINPNRLSALFFDPTGLANVPNGTFDALTIFRHELAHALGFVSSETGEAALGVGGNNLGGNSVGGSNLGGSNLGGSNLGGSTLNPGGPTVLPNPNSSNTGVPTNPQESLTGGTTTPPDSLTTYDLRVGSAVQGVRTFRGPHTSRLFGLSSTTGADFIPLIADDLSHVALYPAALVQANPVLPDLSTELLRPTLGTGQRRGISDLTLAVLADTGVPLKNQSQATARLGDVTVSEAAGTASLPITFSKPLTHDAQFVFTLRNAGTAPSTLADPLGASRGQSLMLSVPAGSTSAVLDLPLANNSVFNSSVLYEISALETNLSAVVSVATANITVTNDEPSPQVQLSGAQASETDGVLNFTLSLTTPVTQDLTFSITTVPADSASAAVAGSDFTAVNTTITLAAGQTQVIIPVTLLSDELSEPQELIALRALQQVTGNATPIDLNATAVLTDASDLPVLSIADATISEGNGQTQVTVQVLLNRASAREIRAGVSLRGDANVIARITLPEAPIIIPAGQTTATYTFTLAGDMMPAANVALELLLTSATNALVQPRGQSQAVTPSVQTPALVSVVTVQDDDSSGSLPVTAGRVTVNRPGDQPALVRLTGAGTLQVTTDETSGVIFIRIVGGDGRSALSVTSRTLVNIGGLEVTGALGRFDAPLGTLQASASVGSAVMLAGLSRLTLANVQGNVQLFSPQRTLAIRAGVISGSVDVEGALASAQVGELQAGATLSASSFSSVRVSGNVAGNLIADSVVGKLTAGSIIGGTVRAGANIASITTGAADNAAILGGATSAELGAAGTFANANAQITALRLRSVSNSTLAAPLLGRLSLGTVGNAVQLSGRSIAGLQASTTENARLRIGSTSAPSDTTSGGLRLLLV